MELGKEGTGLDCRSGSGFEDQSGSSVAVAADSFAGIEVAERIVGGHSCLSQLSMEIELVVIRCNVS